MRQRRTRLQSGSTFAKNQGTTVSLMVRVSEGNDPLLPTRVLTHKMKMPPKQVDKGKLVFHAM